MTVAVKHTIPSQLERADHRILANRMLSERNDAIRRLLRAGESDEAIMRRYGVARTTLDKLRVKS